MQGKQDAQAGAPSRNFLTKTHYFLDKNLIIGKSGNYYISARLRRSGPEIIFFFLRPSRPIIGPRVCTCLGKAGKAVGVDMHGVKLTARWKLEMRGKVACSSQLSSYLSSTNKQTHIANKFISTITVCITRRGITILGIMSRA